MKRIGNSAGEGREGDKWVSEEDRERKEGKKGVGMKIQKNGLSLNCSRSCSQSLFYPAKVVCLPSNLIASFCFLNFRKDVTVVTFVQKEWAQAAGLVGAAGGAGHVFCPVPSCRVVQSACGSSALHRHPDAQLCKCECQQVYCTALCSVHLVLGLYVGHCLFSCVFQTASVIVS